VYLHLPSIGPSNRPGAAIPGRRSQSPNTDATLNASTFNIRTVHPASVIDTCNLNVRLSRPGKRPSRVGLRISSHE
jgi:hypothetical protein